MDKPIFPITVLFLEDNEKWELANEEEIATNLEWFDSEDPEENAIVKDKLDRPVKLKIERLELILFELK